jgi:hypothetical protein
MLLKILLMLNDITRRSMKDLNKSNYNVKAYWTNETTVRST